MQKPSDTLAQQPDRARNYMFVADTLRQEFSKMNVGDGGRLPSERELAQMLNISRPSLREALIVLELQGEIEIRIGSGIYLKDIEAPPPPSVELASPAGEQPAEAAPSMGHSPRDVNQIRFFLEGGIAAHAARFITGTQTKELKASVTAMRRALNQRGRTGDKPLADADRRFHVALASTTDNPLLIQTLKELFDQRYTPVGGSMHRLFDNQMVWQDAIQEHQDIYEAIADRDPLQAQAAMQRHLARAHIRLMAVIG